MDARFEVIDAFVDGERVDAAALKDALAEADGRDYLVDAWLLRETVQEEMSSEPAAPAVSRVHFVRRRPLFFASAVAASLLAGFLVGRQLGDVIVPAPPATPPAPVVVQTTPVAGSFPAPAPTRVIQIEFGTDKLDSRGGD